MSAQTAWKIRPLAPVPAMSTLSAVAEAPRRARASLPVLVSVVMAGFVGMQLLLGVALAGGAFEIDALHAKKVDLVRERTATAEELVRVQSAQYLAENAESLGMVPNANPVYLRLSDAAVLGQPVATPAGGSFPGADVPNSLLDGVPLATQLAAERQATLAGGVAAAAQALAAEAQKQATPTVAPGAEATGSLALPGSEIPKLQTR